MPDLGQFNPVIPAWQTPPTRKPAVKRRTDEQEKKQPPRKKPVVQNPSDDDSDQPHIDEYA